MITLVDQSGNLRALLLTKQRPNETEEACIGRALSELRTPPEEARQHLRAVATNALVAESAHVAGLNGDTTGHRYTPDDFTDVMVTRWFEKRALESLDERAIGQLRMWRAVNP